MSIRENVARSGFGLGLVRSVGGSVGRPASPASFGPRVACWPWWQLGWFQAVGLTLRSGFASRIFVLGVRLV